MFPRDPESAASNRLLKKYSQSTADYGTRRHARRRSAAESHIQLLVSRDARTEDHPLRAIRAMVDEILTQLSRRFDTMYASVGRPSIPTEKLLRAQLLQMLYSIRSERLLMEEMDYNFCFVGL